MFPPWSLLKPVTSSFPGPGPVTGTPSRIMSALFTFQTSTGFKQFPNQPVNLVDIRDHPATVNLKQIDQWTHSFDVQFVAIGVSLGLGLGLLFIMISYAILEPKYVRRPVYLLSAVCLLVVVSSCCSRTCQFHLNNRRLRWVCFVSLGGEPVGPISAGSAHHQRVQQPSSLRHSPGNTHPSGAYCLINGQTKSENRQVLQITMSRSDLLSIS